MLSSGIGVPLAAQDPAPGPKVGPPSEAAKTDTGTADTRTADTRTEVDARRPRWLRGRLATRYWARWTDDADDHDIYSTLTLDVGDEDEHPVTGRFVGRLAWDLDGGESASSPFYSLADSHSGDAETLLYEAYVDLHRLAGLAVVRAGRQTIQETPETAFFDGLRVETDKLGGAKFQAGAYGGVSTHLYEASRTGDWTAGVFTQVEPWKKARVRLDWMHLEDERLLRERDDDIFAAAVWQQLTEEVRVEGQYSRVADRDRDVRAAAWFARPESDLTVRTTFYQLLTTQRDLVLEADPLYSALRDYHPFWQAHLSAAKGVGAGVQLDGGADLRRMTDAADVGIFNRDYERYFVSIGKSDLFFDGLDAQVSFDLWQSDRQDSTGLGLDISKRIGSAWTASAGTYYSLYKYDLFLNRESDDVRTWYARIRHRAWERFSSALSFELEDSDIDTFYFLRLDATWRF